MGANFMRKPIFAFVFLLFCCVQNASAQLAISASSRYAAVPYSNSFRHIPPKNAVLPSCDSIQGLSVTSPSCGRLKVQFNAPPVNLLLLKNILIEVTQNGEYVYSDLIGHTPWGFEINVAPGLYKVTGIVYCRDVATFDDYESAIVQRNIVVKRPECKPILNAVPTPNSQSYSSVTLQWNMNPLTGNCTYDSYRFYAITKQGNSVVRKDTAEYAGLPTSAYWNLYEVFQNRPATSLKPCTNYQVELKNQCGVQEAGGIVRWYNTTANATSTVSNLMTTCCNAAQSLVLENATTTNIKVRWGQIANANTKKHKLQLLLNGQVLQTVYKNTTTFAAQQLNHEFLNLTANTNYKVKVTSICETTEFDNNGNLYTQEHLGSSEEINAATLGLACPMPTYVYITDVTATSLKTSFFSPNCSSFNRFHVVLRNMTGDLLQEKLLTGSNIMLEQVFDNLSPSTDYRIDVHRECSVDASFNVSAMAAVITNYTKTNAAIPSSCNQNPTTFSFNNIKEQEVSLSWSGGNAAALSTNGRRFLVTVTDGPVLVISSNTSATIGGLMPNKTYQAKIKEVFDGQGNTYSTACNEVSGLTFTTKGLDAYCDPDFDVKVTCGTQNSLLLEFTKGTNKDYTNLSAKIRYKDVSAPLWAANPTAINLLGCKIDKTSGDALVNPEVGVPFMIPTTAIPWTTQIANPKSNQRAIISGLASCSFYEVEIDLIATLGGVSKVCKTINFSNYQQTKGSDFQATDDDSDGIPDHCDDEIKNPKGIVLEDLYCLLATPLLPVAATPLLTSADTGIVVRIAKFPVKITSITPRVTANPSGTYSGEGVVSLPFSKTKLKVAFTNIVINSNREVISGKMDGVREDPANYISVQSLINNTNSINSNTKFCDKSPKNMGFDANGIHKGTGLRWDENGFGATGQYIKSPPYPNYQTGDPYDPNYDPRGFKADGTNKNGTPYDDFGCDVHGKKQNGTDCDTVPPPYYWMNSGSASGTALAGSVHDSLKVWIQRSLTTLSAQNDVTLTQKKAECLIIRNAVKTHNTNLAHDANFTLGDNQKWVGLGMYKLFANEPDILNINAPRNTTQGLLEAKHKELYGCDRDEYKFTDFQMLLAQFGNQIDALVIEYENRIKALPQAEANNYKTDIVAFKQWLIDRLAQKVEYEYKLKNKITSIPSEKRLINDAGMLASLSQIDKMQYSQEELFRIQYNQGWEYINGQHRAFYLEAINKERLFSEMPISATGVNLLPISIPKTVMGKQYEIYLDNLTLTTTGGLADAYTIINPTPAEDRLVFKGSQIAFSHFGIPSAVKLSLATNIPVPMGNAMRLNIKGSPKTFVAFDCEGFKGMGVEADIEFCRKYLTPLDKNTLAVDADQNHLVKATIEATMPSWGEFSVGVNMTPFAITGYEDTKWRIDSAFLDMSDINTPSYVHFPPNYLKTNTIPISNPNLWKGFYLKNLSVTLPPQFAKVQGQPLTIAVQDVILDQGGFTGKASVSPLFSTKEGNAGGWGFSIDTFLLAFERNNPVGAGFSGHIQVPLFGEKDSLAYRASIYEGNVYQFALKPLDTVSINAWFAKCDLSPASSLIMQYKDNKFLMEADLSGNLSINKAAKLKGLDSIPFEHLVLRNEAPYFISAGTWGKVPSLGAKIMGFGINIDNVGLVKDSSGLDTKALLNFNLKLNLTKDTSINITAGGGFQFKCHMANVAGRHRWVPDGLKIRELYVNGSFGAVEKIAGIITFFDETTPGNTQYGKGFRGAVDLKIKNLAQVKALALFGNTTNNAGENYRYFFVDALAVFNKGVPIFTGIDLKGLGGGVYYHMNRDTTAYKGFTNSATTNVLALPVGSSLSGIKYIPDDNKGIGIKLSVMIATAKKESAFNANATFEILFNSQKGGGGVSDIWLYGIANFMSKPDTAQKAEFKKNGVKPTKFDNKISGYIDLHYSFAAKTFEGTIKAYATIGNGAIKGGYANDEVGKIEMRFAPNDWYINIGRPEANQRVKLLVAIPNTTTGLTLDAYLDMGKNIPAMPPLPSEVQSLLGVGNFMANESTRASGKGFAFGAAVKIDIPKKDCCTGVKLFYGQFSAGAGFDVMLQDYGNTAICANTGAPLGINGWYASGQLYAYIQGSIGVYALGREYPIMDIGAAALLQAKLPNPFWMRGVVGGRYRILGGLVKGNCKFQFEMGKSCEYDNSSNGGNNSNLDTPLITDISPIDKDSSVNIVSKLEASFAMAVDSEHKIGEDKYELKTKLSLKDNVTNDYVLGNEVLQDGKTEAEFEPDEILTPNNSYTFEVEVTEYKNGSFSKTEKKATTFITGESLSFIPKDNISASYPYDGMYNFYNKESSDGYIELKKGQKALLTKAPDGFEAKVNFKNATTIIATVPFTYNEQLRKVEFKIPTLPKGIGLKFELSFVPKGASNTVVANTPKVLFNAYFRTSKFEKFIHKLDTLKANMTKNQAHAGWYKTNMTEIFDSLELSGDHLIQPLVELEIQTAVLDWLNIDMKNLMYDKLPQKLIFTSNGAFCNQSFNEKVEEKIEFSWKKVGDTQIPTLPSNSLYIAQPYRLATTINAAHVGQQINLTAPQNLVFDLFRRVSVDYEGAKKALSNFAVKAYDKCILVTPECMGNPPFYSTQSCQTTKTRCYEWFSHNPFSTPNLDPNLINSTCYDRINSFLSQKGLSELYKQNANLQPSGNASRITIRYRLPGRDKKATTIDYIEPPQNKNSGGGNGNGSGNGTPSSTNGKTGYAPPSGGGGSRSVAGEALKVLDFLQIDEKLLSYSDLEAEAIDLYTKHGFRTYIIPKYPIFYNLSDLGKIEHQKDVTKGIKALNTDGKPYIVIELTLGNDLDFKGEVLLINDGSRSLSDNERDNIKSTIEETFHVGTDTNLNVTEAADAIDYFRFMLDAPDNNYNPDNDFPVTELSKMKSITIDVQENSSLLARLRDAKYKFNLFYDKVDNSNDAKIIKAKWGTLLNYYKCHNHLDKNIATIDKNTIDLWVQHKEDFKNWKEEVKNNVVGMGSDSETEYNGFLSILDDFYRLYDIHQTQNKYVSDKYKDYFESQKLKDVLTAINIGLKPVAIKAIGATESADFYNRAISCLSDAPQVKGYGYYDDESGYVGITNMLDESANLGASWIKNKGIIVAWKKNDKRIEPEDCILSTAGYLGYNYDIVKQAFINGNYPKGIDAQIIALSTLLCGGHGMQRAIIATQKQYKESNPTTSESKFVFNFKNWQQNLSNVKPTWLKSQTLVNLPRILYHLGGNMELISTTKTTIPVITRSKDDIALKATYKCYNK